MVVGILQMMPAVYDPILPSDIKLDDPRAVILLEDVGSALVFTIYTTEKIDRSEASFYFVALRREYRRRRSGSPNFMPASRFYADEYPDGNNVYRFVFESA